MPLHYLADTCSWGGVCLRSCSLKMRWQPCLAMRWSTSICVTARTVRSLSALRNLGALGELAGLPAEIFMAGYSKEQELEADRDGTTLAVEAGYSPRGILQLFAEFSKLEQRWGGSTAPTAPGPVSEAAGVSLATLQGYFQSHPPAAQRSRQIEAMIAAQRWSSPPVQPLRCRSVSAGKCSSSAG